MAGISPSGPSIPARTALVAAVAAVAASAALATVPPPEWELSAFRVVNGLGDLPAAAWWPVMQLGSLAGAIVLTLAISIAKRWHHAGTHAMSTGLAWLGAQLVKSWAGRPRPTQLGIATIVRGAEATGAGYPSGHAALAFAAATIFAFEMRGRWRAVPYVLAVLVAITRVYVGAHLPLDVIGGAGLGLAVGLIVRFVSSRFNRVAGPATPG
jgi:glycosyltransferase 2 family protein